MKNFIRKLTDRPPFPQLLESLAASDATVKLSELPGGLPAIVADFIRGRLQVPLLLIAPGPAPAERVLSDIIAVAGPDAAAMLPPLRSHPFESAPLSSGPRNERTESLLRLQSGSPVIYVTQPEALLERVPSSAWIRRQTLMLKVGEDYPRNLLLSNLVEAGYTRESLVDSQGQFAVRGGLVDVFPLGQELPVRLEFDFDRIASIRHFDPTNQRSRAAITDVQFLIGDEENGEPGTLADLLPPSGIIFWLDLVEAERRIIQFFERLAKAQVRITDAKASGRLMFNDFAEAFGSTQGKRQILGGSYGTFDGSGVNFVARRPDPFAEGLEGLPAYLRRYEEKGFEVWIAAENEGERERLDELLTDGNLLGVATVTPTFSGGFVSEWAGLAMLTSHELLGRRRLPSRGARFRRRSVQFDRSSLRTGDLVVHATYGIGKFEGMATVKVRGQPMEALRIRYQDDVVLYVRVEHFGLVEKYLGAEGSKPQISKIGTGEWARTKKRTKKALQDIAGELIKLYAERKYAEGHAFPSDTHWQREMEASFEYTDTPDQVLATIDVKADLESPHPMDRLLSGDVGFGKTEIAIRAAFKVVQDSQQAAILVPTTILAQQHYETFKQRLASYPVKVEVLSRFVSPADQKKVLADLKTGKVDVVIGTHRLLSQDVGFKRLGLIIIDEEHRFGVRHKERLKHMKVNVDVLTMTATPIPRTLHMALMGARDTTQINTPPVDRLPVITEVHGFSEELIRDAILHEADRQGQVFFLHNRVESIYAVKGMLERLVPGLRYAVGHGQMGEGELERVMVDFMTQKIDVLICTTIIESGIDIPNANTLLVNRADKFGLAQLYQIRGRIGRSSRQAYAYLLTPPRIEMTPEARRRLATLAELTDLGSGMKIALRDLEIRGAGNLLGAEQHGFINAVGFDLYTKLLEEAVSEIKGEPIKEELTGEEDLQIDYDGPALLPGDYIDDGDIRYEFYRRVAATGKMEEIDGLEEELRDRFGSPPQEARNLLDLMRLKIMGRKLRFRHIKITDKYVSAALNLPADPAESQAFIGRLVASADPEPVEFRALKHVEMLHRYTVGDSLRQARRFLQRLTREGIFQV